ncbi:hypothetical protein WN51_13915 [Melipona quadrifasciata]|uniref:Uncharacterized protein n=1 Tax=Melipona quadrifasciata TaxID=166423 RepID=A0A0M8ZZ28_9HYME|nr:hypothetical protein WN51_13915 [Melipona quadrifasciata]
MDISYTHGCAGRPTSQVGSENTGQVPDTFERSGSSVIVFIFIILIILILHAKRIGTLYVATPTAIGQMLLQKESRFSVYHTQQLQLGYNGIPSSLKVESVRVNEAPLCSFYPRPSTVDGELRTLKITAAQRLTGFMGHRVNEDLDRGFIGEEKRLSFSQEALVDKSGLATVLRGSEVLVITMALFDRKYLRSLGVGELDDQSGDPCFADLSAELKLKGLRSLPVRLKYEIKSVEKWILKYFDYPNERTTVGTLTELADEHDADYQMRHQ